MNRRGQRRSANVTVRFITRPTSAGVGVGVGVVTNVSPTGAFLETHFPLHLLSLVYVEPLDPMPTDTGRKRLAATVVRIEHSGVGLEWYEFGAENTEVYAHLLDGVNDMIDPHQLPLPAFVDCGQPSKESR